MGWQDAPLVTTKSGGWQDAPLVSASDQPAPTTQSTLPDWAKNYPKLHSALKTTREMVGPSVELLTSAAGGLALAPIGPAGMIAGGALGYGAGKALTHAADVALGTAQPETLPQAAVRGTNDLLEGALGGVAGEVAAPLIGKVVSGVAKGAANVAGRTADIFAGPPLSKIKAAEIARNALGPDLEAAKNLLRSAPQDITAGQATAGVNSPTWQALMDRAVKRDPRFLMALEKSQGDASLNALQQLAGGASQTAAQSARIATKNALLNEVKPVIATELGAANQATKTLGKLEPQLAQKQQSYISAIREGMPMGEGAPGLQTVHPSTEAAQSSVRQQAGKPGWLSNGDRAVEWAKTGEDFAKIADQRRAEAGFLERQIGSLEAHGLRPIDTGAITKSLDTTINAPGTRASPTTVKVLQAVNDDIRQLAARNGGIIDAHDLYTLRKEGIGERIDQLMSGVDPKASRKIAADVLGKIKPMIDSAIENAGGTGWTDYLKKYATEMHKIRQSELSAEAMSMFKTDPAQFVKLVQGEKPEIIEKIFGPGSYDIAKEMSAKAMDSMGGVVKNVTRDTNVASQAAAGQDALRTLLTDHFSKFKLPWNLSAKTAVINKALTTIEGKIDRKTLEALTEASKSGKSATELLNVLPAKERIALLKAIREYPVTMPKSVGTYTAAPLANALVSMDNQNALTQ